ESKRLSDLYVPLSIESNRQATQINGYPETLIDGDRSIFIIDSGGMGKSTLLKRMYLGCIERNSAIPIFIALRQLTPKVDLVELIRQELSPLGAPVEYDVILQLVKRGDFVFFLDGYDEIPFSDRVAVADSLQSFVSRTPECRYVLTSRPDPSLSGFSGFKHYSVQPLSLDGAKQLFRKYDVTPG